MNSTPRFLARESRRGEVIKRPKHECSGFRPGRQQKRGTLWKMQIAVVFFVLVAPLASAFVLNGAHFANCLQLPGTQSMFPICPLFREQTLTRTKICKPPFMTLRNADTPNMQGSFRGPRNKFFVRHRTQLQLAGSSGSNKRKFCEIFR